MKKAQLLLATMVITPLASYGLPVTLFNAEQSCEARNTSTGVRYVPPCNFIPQVVEPEQNSVAVEKNFVLEGQFKSSLVFHFTCETLRPLNISYTASDNNRPVITNITSGSATQSNLLINFTHQYNGALFSTQELTGTVGFQAIKPGCRMEINNFISYPDPEFYTLLGNSLINVDRLLKTIFSSTSPDMNYIAALGAIDNSLLLFSFLRPQSDELTQVMIDQTVEDLTIAKEALSQNCGADSSTRLCTAVIAKARNTIQLKSIENEFNLVVLKDYLESQVNWISEQSMGLDVEHEKLQSILNKLIQQLAI